MSRVPKRLQSLELTARTAQKAADIIAAMRDSSNVAYQERVTRVDIVLRSYGERNVLGGVDFDELKYVTRTLYKVFIAQDVSEAAAILNDILTEFAGPPYLSRRESGVWSLYADDGDGASWVKQFTVSSALAFAALLTEEDKNPCRLCASPSCSRPLISFSKNGNQHYCSTRCATRERVAVYRKRVA
ncbi:MAG TPA: CGNR zinc finger domain-containing protein [Verrucomicrobiae bacterium]|nr:CGNR zinc finger domain-containing protein [Verrucomicrobiae bacterium]